MYAITRLNRIVPMPRARRSGGYMSPAAVRAAEDVEGQALTTVPGGTNAFLPRLWATRRVVSVDHRAEVLP